MEMAEEDKYYDILTLMYHQNEYSTRAGKHASLLKKIIPALKTKKVYLELFFKLGEFVYLVFHTIFVMVAFLALTMRSIVNVGLIAVLYFANFVEAQELNLLS